MNRVLLILILIVSLPRLKAQDNGNFTDPRRIMHKLPDSLSNTTADIAGFIKSNFDNDTRKISAIYSWVTTNIRYDKDSANAINLGVDQDARITVALRRRRGVCENYAAIFNDICLKSGLTSVVVNGYTKQGGFVDKTGHAWCAVRVDGKWYLFDPTWDEGGGTTKYFMVQPSEFIDSHMPYDPLWQLLNYPISHREFSMNNSSKSKKDSYFNYEDSITAWLKMDSLERFKSTASRIQNEVSFNPLVKTNQSYIKMNIEMIRQDKDADLYNSAVADLNEATKLYNNFVEYRNKQFTPEKTDTELQESVEGIDKILFSALKKLDQVDKSEATFTLGTEPVRNRINKLTERINSQKDFVSRYIKTEKSNRQALFYGN
jgi:hypothetical protein